MKLEHQMVIKVKVELVKKQYNEYLELEQKVQQIVGLRKISMTNAWDLDKRFDLREMNVSWKQELKVSTPVFN